MRAHPIRQKLQSQQGASILFALFFFIVCAVIGSIVLTAATAAAGRMSRVKEMDERYYAVNSAAEVMEREINRSVVIGSKSQCMHSTDGVDWAETDDETAEKQFGSFKKTMTYSSRDEKDIALTGIPQVIYHMLHNPTDSSQQTFVVGGDPIQDISDRVTVEVKLEMLHGDAAAAMSMPDKSLLVTITGTNEERGEEQSYTLTLKCQAHKDERTEYTEKVLGAMASGGTRYRLITEKERLTWSVASVIKGGHRHEAHH